MNSTAAQPFALSLVLHLACGVGLVAALSQPLRELTAPARPETLSVFQLEPASTSPVANNVSSAGQAVSFPQLPSLPKFIPPPVSNTLETETYPAPSTISSTKTPTAPSRTSYDEFRRMHPQPGVRSSSPVPSRASSIPTINPKDFVYSSGSNAATSSAGGTGETNADAEFIARLKAEIRRRYADKNAAATGLSAQFEFTLADDGTLKNTRLLESSGSAEFDQSVLFTFQRIRTSGYLPSTIGKTFRLRFQVTDGL